MEAKESKELSNALERSQWQQSTEWKRKIEVVLNLKERDYSLENIIKTTKYPEWEVRRIYEDEKSAIITAAEMLEMKLPVIKDILGMGLTALRARLVEIVGDPEELRKVLKTVQDMNALTKIIEVMNTLTRLEEGKSTQNTAIAHSYQATREAIQELKKKDPIFEYE